MLMAAIRNTSPGGAIWLRRTLSSADKDREPEPLLELVSACEPAARQW
jgi:hypothetical protein